MSKGPDLLKSEEKKSYAAVFLLTVALLVACTVWAVWQDTFSRHLWKKYKTDFYRLAISKYEGELAAERERLSGIDEYVALQTELEDVTEKLEGDGPEGAKIEELEAQLVDLDIRVLETDLDHKTVKGEIEEAWYHVEHALHNGQSADEERQHLKELQERREATGIAYEEAAAARDAVQEQIDELNMRVSEIAEEMRPYHSEIDALELKLDGVSMQMMGRRVPMVPTIDQVVLNEFERNNFDNWVPRVERCMNCHVAIDREGFEKEENPLKTHPNREYYIGNHETRLFGCTPCHGGQGASINSVALAHGEVQFWEDPLLKTPDMVQAKCETCHSSVQGLEGAETAARGEWLFKQLGCHGCHLVSGYDELPKAGPSLARIGAKVSPEWLVDWVEEPKKFRPRTRMPHFFLTRDESESVAAYLLATSIGGSQSWLDEHPDPAGVNANSAPLVEHGKELAESIGCLGCHGFEPDTYASEVAIGKDTAPNLSRIAEKTDEQWIFSWLKNPRGYSETARMPRLRLDDAEARAVTSYLLTLKQDDPLPADPALRTRMAQQETIDDGERLVRKYGCPGCHVIPGMENESRVSVELSAFGDKFLEELFFGDRLDIPLAWEDWTYNKILTPRTYETDRIEQAMPEFGFDPADAQALTTYLKGRSKHAINHKYLPDNDGLAAKVVRGRELISYYNCQGCHTFDGKEGAIQRFYEGAEAENAPPTLVKEGIKLQPDWFFDFLKKPMRLRPWLDVRMPSFGMSDDEATAIVEYFGALDGFSFEPVVIESREEAHSALAVHAAAADEPVDCRSCHPAGKGKVADDRYAVSAKALTDAEIAAWLAEKMGIEAPGGGEGGDKAEDLAEFMGVSAN
jgi:mono/diheme cytochrome c family protein/predicted  nucleic acid-binding Zn-ribbon protein